jgi:hypothetical protein
MYKGGKPADKDFFIATRASYDKKAPGNIDGYKLLVDGETMDLYLNQAKKEILIALRGTASLKDVITDLNFASNTLKYTTRYKKDKKTLEKYLLQYPAKEYNYYITGHSLGGGLSSQFMRDFPFIKEGMVYNSAVQPIDLIKQNPDIKYLYINKDPLYQISGRFLDGSIVYPYTKNLNGILGKFLPETIQAHKLNQFDKLYGGTIPDNILDKDKYLLAKKKADSVYKSHGLYKSAFIQKEYQRLNGRYADNKPSRKEGINRWLDEKWISLIPYLESGEVKQCGSLNNELIACRPLYRISPDTPITVGELITKFGKEHILKLAKIKDKKPNIRINWEQGKIY